MASKARTRRIAFQHTHLGVYISVCWALFCIVTDSLQGVIEKYHLNKKWFYLYGVLCFFAYLYMLPFVRDTIGSAKRGYINFYTLYIFWLCSALFYHLPSLETLGLDVKGDVSMLISVFYSSLLVLGLVHGVQYALGYLRVLSHQVLSPGLGLKKLVSSLMLNSFSLSVACSTYFSYCGNGAVSIPQQGSLLKHQLCAKWLHPISTTEFPTFSAWMLYGEGARQSNAQAANSTTYLSIDLPLDGVGIVQVPAGKVISPVFTMWITLVAMYLVNALADYCAVTEAKAKSIGDIRRQHSEPNLAILKKLAEEQLGGFLGNEEGPGRRWWSRDEGEGGEGVKMRRRGVERSRSLELDRSSWSRKLATTVSHLVERSHQLGEFTGKIVEQNLSNLERLSGHKGLTANNLLNQKTLRHLLRKGSRHLPLAMEEDRGDSPDPGFLPMVPWYSGTSADLFKTMFDLMVSLKLFLGRFDMRTMQAATAASMADSFNDTPSRGDGFTYEHYGDRQELWVDFIADTGDGGNPTYAVARALAAPNLTAEVAPDVKLPGEIKVPHAKCDNGLVGQLSLPRADVLLIGGDLAYPNPSKETYEQRLFKPFEEALPPPPHYHPGRLVVHKPDLPPVYGVQEATVAKDLLGLSPRSSRHASYAALRQYEGPNCFAIPGNHDWIDGLETFMKQILHKGWLGGWLLPQEKSYFALRLPHGWWVFGLDLALVGDIDMCQYRYFANVVEQCMSPGDQVIVMTHEPVWLLEWFWMNTTATNMRQLIRGHLRGRARVHLAGDLHFYMRHSFKPNNGTPGDEESRNKNGVPDSGRQSLATGVESSMEHNHPLVGNTLMQHTTSTPKDLSNAFRARGVTDDDSLFTTDEEEDVESADDSEEDHCMKQDETLGAPGLCSADKPRRTAGERGFSQEMTEGGFHGNELPLRAPGTSHQSLVCSPATTASVNICELPGPGSRLPGAMARSPGAAGEDHASGISALKPTAGPGTAEEPPLTLGSVSSAEVPHHHSAPQGLVPSHTRVKPLDFSVLAKVDNVPGSTREEEKLHDLVAPEAMQTEAQTEWGQLGQRPATTSMPNPQITGMQRTSSRGGLFLRPPPLNLSQCPACQQKAMGPHLYDPEHLIVNGLGGAFLHPTHVFSYAQFTTIPDDAAEATAAIYSTVQEPCTCRVYPQPQSGSWFDLEYPNFQATPFRSKGATQPEGQYTCGAVYPPPKISLKLGRKNLHLFRFQNTRFDVIGGMLYFLCVVSVMPRCGAMIAVLDAPTFSSALLLFLYAYCGVIKDIIACSYLSLTAVVTLFALTFGFARTGGVGAAKGLYPRSTNSNGSKDGQGSGQTTKTEVVTGPWCWARTGGLTMQVAVAMAHGFVHLTTAITLLLLLELGIEICIRHESLGASGVHGLYRWFEQYEEEHFPDPMGLRSSLRTATFGLYPGIIKYAMTIFDLPEAIAVTRSHLCEEGGGLHAVSRLQAVGYYLGMLAYYWVLATPAMGFVFGLYLYISVCWFYVHYDEAFSALRISDYKGFSRLHVTSEGDLEVFTIVMDKVPKEWAEDVAWTSEAGGGSRMVAAHHSEHPSRWIPGPKSIDDDEEEEEEAATASGACMGEKHMQGKANKADVRYRVVDYLKVPKARNMTGF